MAVTQRLDLRQHQSLVMTPQLQQAIKLLQLSNLELAAYVEAELEQNPLLERDEGDGGGGNVGGDVGDEIATGSGVDSDAAAADGRADSSTGEVDTHDLTRAENLPASGDAPLDADLESQYDNSRADDGLAGADYGARISGAGNTFDGDERGLEQRLSERTTLRQHLLDQVNLDLRDPAERIIALHLVEMLDESGYMTGDIIALAARLDCDVSDIEAVLGKLQRLDPPGVFARTLRECLAIQLAERDRLDPAMATMLDNLPLVARHEYAALRKLCGVDEEDLKEMIAEIKALNPKPAEAYDFEVADPIVPDILVRRGLGDKWLVELNSDTLPRVLVNARYSTTVSSRARSKADREYISQQLQSANWLVKSLHQRATTILKVASEILRQQDAFFRKGVRHLRPLTLRDIAEAIEMHESTVSRVTTNKYIATPRGIYELKYFFTASIAGANGESHSAEAVRDRIKALIDAESGSKILSDDTIVELLRADGVEIARRTVAKYREAMRIPSSVQRRREKSLHAEKL
jgi:RNA polymerase sigma-54 factor